MTAPPSPSPATIPTAELVFVATAGAVMTTIAPLAISPLPPALAAVAVVDAAIVIVAAPTILLEGLFGAGSGEGGPVDAGARLLEVAVPARVGPLLAGAAVGAEAGEVVRAQLAADVALAAAGAQLAEAALVVGAGRQLAARVDVQVQALVAVGTVAVAYEEVALGHLTQVVLVQELAALALLAQAPEPMLAYQAVETTTTSSSTCRLRRRR